MLRRVECAQTRGIRSRRGSGELGVCVQEGGRVMWEDSFGGYYVLHSLFQAIGLSREDGSLAIDLVNWPARAGGCLVEIHCLD